MKDDFQHLEDDMTHLSSRMEEIISSSNSINTALSDRKKQITKLCGVHHLLKKVCTSQMTRLPFPPLPSWYPPSKIACMGQY